MIPLYKPGNHVLTFNWTKIRVGDVIVFKINDKNYIKRIINISEKLIHVEGDNKKESAKFKPIRRNLIIGKLILKY